jgi:peptidoglycan hydrolase CwlO-like protein
MSSSVSYRTNADAVKDAQSKLATYQAQAANIQQQVADLNSSIEYKTQRLSQAKAEADALRSR